MATEPQPAAGASLEGPAADPVQGPIVRAIAAAVPGSVTSATLFRGTLIVAVEPARAHDVLRFLRDDASMGFDMLLDVVTIDWSEHQGGRVPRFDVVYNLLSLTHHHRVQVRVGLSEDDPVLPTACDIWPGANWFEREAFDMMGIRFTGHPNLTRILTHAGFTGHALRKDYRADRRQPTVLSDTVVSHE